MSRERDMRRAVRDALKATGQFDEVHLSEPETWGFGASEGAAAIVEPDAWSEKILMDGGRGTVSIRTATLRVCLLARNPDPELCDDAAEDLLQYARNAIDGQALVPGFNMPDTTRLINGRWLPRTPPERRIEATLTYQYMVDGWADNDTSP